MAHLHRDVLRGLIDKGLVTDFANVDSQLTPNGFDVRVCAFVEVLEGGRLAVDKSNNVAPKLGRAFVLPGFESRLDGYVLSEKIVSKSFVELKRNQPYFVVSCERVNMPSNIMMSLAQRSSVFRLSQSLMGFGFGEAGYSGFLTFIIVPFLDCSIELGARVAQMSFSLLTGDASYLAQKESNYFGGKLF